MLFLAYVMNALFIPAFLSHSASDFGDPVTAQDYVILHKIMSGTVAVPPDHFKMRLVKEQLDLQRQSPLGIIKAVHNIHTPNEIDSSAPKKRADIYKLNGEDIYFYNFKNTSDFTLMDSRLRAFVELPGKELLNDYQLYENEVAQTMTNDNGFDYSVKDIARFFTEAEKRKIKLNPWELQLQRQLLQLNLIKKTNGQFAFVKDAAILGLVGASRGTKDHELNHGIYFSNTNYRKQCDAFYAGLGSREKKILSRFLTPHQYDHTDQSLMARETCASLRDWETLKTAYFHLNDQQENQLLEQAHRKVLAIDRFSEYYQRQGQQKPEAKKNREGVR